MRKLGALVGESLLENGGAKEDDSLENNDVSIAFGDDTLEEVSKK